MAPQRAQPYFTARPHQEEASGLIQEAMRSGSPGFLLADEVGTGKTMSAWDAILSLPEKQAKQILIVTTASALAHWRHTILHAGWNPNHAITVINYDRLERLFTVDKPISDRRKGKKKRIAKQGKAPAYDLIVWDESHRGINPSSARGLMMRKMAKAAGFNIWASATAGENPIHLAYLSPLLEWTTGQSIDAETLDAFSQWCARQGMAVKTGAYGKIEWERNEHDIAQIRGWLFDGKPTLAVRRLPQDIAGWPEMERQLMPVTLDPTQRAAFGQAWETFKRELIQAQQSGAPKTGQARTGTTPGNSKTPQANLESSKIRLRQQASWLRIPNTADMAMELLEQGKQVAISVAFLDSLHGLAQIFREKGIEPATIHGKNSKAENETNRLDFQHGRTPVAIFTVEEAISLHQGEHNDAPRVLLLHDVRWTARQLAQIEGRCHRDGALAPVWWLVGEGTIEMEIAHVMGQRLASMKSLVGDDTADAEAITELIRKHLDD